MNSKSTMMLFLAVVCGLGAMYGTSKMLSKDRGPKPAEFQEVLVAAQNLKAEEVIKKEMVKTTRMPKDSVPAGSFTSVDQALERGIQIPILLDEPILEAKLMPKGTPPGLISRIPMGMRAFAIEVNEQTAVSGFVLPGHRVDVVQSMNSGGIDTPQAQVILENVLVLASGQTLIRPEDKSILSRTVTVAVLPEQVDALVAARARGPLTLSLRGLNDNEILARVTPPSPPPAPPPPPPAPPPPPPAAELALVVAPKIEPPAIPAIPPQPERRRIIVFRGLQSPQILTLPRPGELYRAEDSEGP
jgi:pilus assembly protein CpaB